MLPVQTFPCLADARLVGNAEVIACAAHGKNLEAIFESVEEGIATVGADGSITLCNRRLARMLRMDRDALLGSKADQVLSTLLPELPELIERVRTERRPQREVFFELPSRNPDESPQTYVVTIEFLNGGHEESLQSGLVIVIRDTSELHALRREQIRRSRFQRLVGQSKPMLEVYRLIEHVAPTDATVLILGESGTGKELVASSIHNLSARSTKPFVKVNCAALSESLLESELFGHVRGSFTGAYADRIGRFELAKGGTIFLDEIGDVPISVQVKLLRVLQERVIERVGESEPRKVDVRVLAATHQDLRSRIEQGKFREDLYYRLKVMELRLPSLRERRTDIPVIVDYFIEKFNTAYGRQIEGVAPQTLERLMNYAWPGNVRELENAIEHAFVLCTQGRIMTHHLPAELREFHPIANETRFFMSNPTPANGATGFEPEFATAPAAPGRAAEPEDEAATIREALRRANGRAGRAAKSLNMHRSTLWRKMRQHGIEI